jgi:hypothetical protein
VTFDDEAEQYLILALLRPGTSPAKLGAINRLRRLVQKLRAAFPGARLRVRLDGGFAGDDVLRVLEAEGVEYVVALGKNRRLEKRVRRLMGHARVLAKASGETEHLFGETRYAARRWKAPRRVIMKAEVVRHADRAPKNNPRFVVTNLPHTPEHVYTIYRQRGDVENRIKELKSQPGPGSPELFAVSRQSVPPAAHCGGLHLGAGAPAPRGRHAMRDRAGHHAARAAGQGCGVGHAVGAPHRAALPDVVSVAARVVADRLRGRRATLTLSRSSRRLAPGRGLDVEPHGAMVAERAALPLAGDLSKSPPGRHVEGANNGPRVDCSRLRCRTRVFTHKAG